MGRVPEGGWGVIGWGGWAHVVRMQFVMQWATFNVVETPHFVRRDDLHDAKKASPAELAEVRRINSR
jgi:hypothetical protein